MITNLLRLMLGRSARPFVFENKNNYKLDFNVSNIGLYVHIPFCETLCSFCPYNKTKYDKTLALQFKSALINEIHLAGQLSGYKRDVTSLYFGGGTPSLMIDDLPEVMSVIRKYFNIIGNTGIELHPRDVNEALLYKVKEAGFDMVSIGIQSFQPGCLASLNREQSNHAQRLRLVQNAGFKAVDVDLIFGIPGQTAADLQKDFLIAIENGATQISTYPFIDFSFAQNKRKPLGRGKKKEMLSALVQVSKESGYERTSVWTFSKIGTPKYSSVTRDNFIGFGPSATTLLKDIFKLNTFSVEEYIASLSESKIPTALTLSFSERSRALYWLFWSSYNLDINKKSFNELFGKNPEDMFGFELNIAAMFKYVERYDGGFRLTEKASYLFHLIEQKYTHQYIDKTWRIAGRNPWPEKIVLY